MRKIYALLLVFIFIGFSDINAQPSPCNLTGGSVYVDHSTTPVMMNATVNGMSQYLYTWSNGLSANQTQYYQSWCVTIFDIMSGCDTTICENCIADTTTICPCPMIYMPVCGCDGVMYSNSCLAECAEVGWSPAISNGMPGGFLPCTPPISCGVELMGDSIICNWGSPQILTASPNSTSSLPVTYMWNTGQTGPVLTITTPGTYCVTQIDANGCIDSACITVSLQEIPIYTNPSPPIICLGDSIVLEIDTFGLSNIGWVPNSLPTPPVHRIVDFPIVSHPYIVEAIDAGGCQRRGEVFVTVDSCTVCIDSSLINLQIMCPMVWDPVCGCDGVTYGNDCEALNWGGITSWTQGPCFTPPLPCTVEINNGTVDIEVCDGDTAILEATIGFDTYLWTEASSGASLGANHFISVTDPGLYIVIATDSTNCVDMDSIEVIVYPETPLNPMTVPNPPEVCVGDSVVIEVNSGFLNYWWNTNNPLDEDEDRIVVFPTQDFTYVVEALDVNGCESREEILVLVDTCATGVMNILSDQVMIYPNPSAGIMTINLPKNEVFALVIFDVSGQLVLSKEKVMNSFIIDGHILSNGLYVMKLMHNNGLIIRKILFE